MLARTLSTGIETPGAGRKSSLPSRREPYPRGLKQRIPFPHRRQQPPARTLSTGIETNTTGTIKPIILTARTLSTGIETEGFLCVLEGIALARTLSTGIETTPAGVTRLPGRPREPYPRGLKRNRYRAISPPSWREPYPRGLKLVGCLRFVKDKPKGANLIHGD